jgi:hypothetical protein
MPGEVSLRLFFSARKEEFLKSPTLFFLDPILGDYPLFDFCDSRRG